MSHLMRMRLNPDASKMILCTKGGYMMVVHNLSLPHMATDLIGFKVTLIFNADRMCGNVSKLRKHSQVQALNLPLLL